jgi:glyoxylase-like metal-dependent hydrolase (beta-lactamase superfamily II)
MKTAIFLAAAALLATALPAQAWKIAGGFSTDWKHVTIEKIQLAPHITFLHGSGGNVVVSTGPDGILMVDCEFTQMSGKLMTAIARLEPGPVRFLIDTHFHGDHTGGNADFAKTGTIVVAQENVLLRMSAPQHSYFGNTVPPAPPEARPMITFGQSMKIRFNGEDVLLFHESPAHTDGDTVVYFPKSNVVHMGDLYINGLYPIIDLSVGGTIDGYFPIIDRTLRMINDETKVIPGHGPVATKKELQAYRDMLEVIRNRVQKMLAEGKTLPQIQAAHPSQEYDADWASDRVGPDQVVKMIYEGLVGPDGKLKAAAL